MDLKKIVNAAFQETYKPLTDWQRYVIQEAVDLCQRIDSEEGFVCSLGSGFSTPISYYEYEIAGEKKNKASVSLNITVQNQSTSLSVNFIETLRNGTRKAKCSVGSIFSQEAETEIDLSNPKAIEKLLERVAEECGRKMAEEKMSQQLSDAIAAQRLLSTKSYEIFPFSA